MTPLLSVPPEPTPLWIFVTRLRYRLGAWVIGDGLLGYLSWQALVIQRTRVAIREDGRVTLADCKDVADVLYGATPGNWNLTVTKVVP